jgi:hypothetical protein
MGVAWLVDANSFPISTMDPVTITIVAALAAGAIAGISKVTTSAIEDAYAGLKRVITDHYYRAVPFVEAVQAEPASKPKQAVLARQLEQIGAAKDDQPKGAAQVLLAAVDQLRAKPEVAALFDFDHLQLARNARFKDIDAVQVLRVRGKAEIGSDLMAQGIRQMPSRGGAEKN